MKRFRWIVSAAAVLGLAGCGGSSDDGNAASAAVDGLSVTTTQSVVLPSSYQPNDGRLLASQCFQCHGTNGRSTNRWHSIAGEADEIYESGHPLMAAQARGYTPQEIGAIAMWLGGEGGEGGERGERGESEGREGGYEGGYEGGEHEGGEYGEYDD